MPRKKRRRPSRKLPLDERHRLAIEMLAGLRERYEDAAQTLGISRMTLWRWRKRADFKQELRRATDRILSDQFRDMRRGFALKNLDDIEWFARMSGIE